MKLQFRESLSWLHTWSGLVLGLAIALFAITGAGLVLRPNLDVFVNRHLLAVPACNAPRPLDRLVRDAERAYPNGEFRAVEITADPTASLAVRFADDTYVYLNPCSAEILGIKNHYAGFFGTLDWLHRFRFIGNPEHDLSGKITGGLITAVFLVLLIVGGLLLWWPRTRGEWKNAAAFQWRRRGSARTLSLHKVVGLYSALLLLLITLTALPLSFQPFRDLIGWATNSPVASAPPPRLSRPAHGKPLPLQELWQLAEARVGDIAWASLYRPAATSAVAEVEILQRGAPHANAKSFLYLNAYNGETIRLSRYATGMPEGRKVYLYLLALHSGLVGGLGYQLLLLLAVLGIPVQVYSGASVWLRRKFRKAPPAATLRLRLVRKMKEAESIASFEFTHPDGRSLPPFSAGSHIDVTPLPGLTRQYSLCNDPNDTHRYVIAVLRCADSRGGSQAMHEVLKAGDLVEVSVPRNHFPLAHSAARSLLIAGGIGITPILCMAERLANSGADFRLHYCMRSRGQAAFLERIAASDFARRAQLHVSDEGTRLDIDALLDSEPRDSHLYICGPAGFMDAVIAAAAARGWPETLIHREYFAAAAHDSARDTAFDVRIASTGQTIRVERDETAVVALARHGILIPTSCSEGVCGTCVTRVIEGEIEHNDVFLTGEERARNDQFTPCCSRARSPLLVLDL